MNPRITISGDMQPIPQHHFDFIQKKIKEISDYTGLETLITKFYGVLDFESRIKGIENEINKWDNNCEFQKSSVYNSFILLFDLVKEQQKEIDNLKMHKQL